MDDKVHTPPKPIRSGPLDGPPSPIELDVVDTTDSLLPAATAWLRSHALAALTALNTAGEVRARIVDDRTMSAAHQRYSGIPGTTDVLTFDMADLGPTHTGRALDVDLLICIDEARRQAAPRAHPVERELLLYIIHGVLHCLGFDDHSDQAAAAMHAREDQILQAIGVGPTYAATPRNGGPA